MNGLVGIDEAMREVIARLAKGDVQKRIVVSIAGFAGLGKTTLARAVYGQIQGQFDCTAFVSVARNPDTRKLLKDMLDQFDEEKFKEIDTTKLDETHLKDLVREIIQNKRYTCCLLSQHVWPRPSVFLLVFGNLFYCIYHRDPN